nr:hypothetical protein Iba_chr13dCG6520 [Ipomoea batatas]
MCNSYWNRCIDSQFVTFVKRAGAAGDEGDGIGVGLFEGGASLEIEIFSDRDEGGVGGLTLSFGVLGSLFSVALVLFLIRKVRPILSSDKSVIHNEVIAAHFITLLVSSIFAWYPKAKHSCYADEPPRSCQFEHPTVDRHRCRGEEEHQEQGRRLPLPLLCCYAAPPTLLPVAAVLTDDWYEKARGREWKVAGEDYRLAARRKLTIDTGSSSWTGKGGPLLSTAALHCRSHPTLHYRTSPGTEENWPMLYSVHRCRKG